MLGTHGTPSAQLGTPSAQLGTPPGRFGPRVIPRRNWMKIVTHTPVKCVYRNITALDSRSEVLVSVSRTTVAAAAAGELRASPCCKRYATQLWHGHLAAVATSSTGTAVQPGRGIHDHDDGRILGKGGELDSHLRGEGGHLSKRPRRSMVRNLPRLALSWHAVHPAHVRFVW